MWLNFYLINLGCYFLTISLLKSVWQAISYDCLDWVWIETEYWEDLTVGSSVLKLEEDFVEWAFYVLYVMGAALDFFVEYNLFSNLLFNVSVRVSFYLSLDN